MRVIECDECGEAISAANDDELQRHLADHMRDEHEVALDDEQVEELVQEEAYDAADS